jgi:hypothetical protein
MKLARNNKAQTAKIQPSKNKKAGKGAFILFVGDEGGILSCIEHGVVTRRLYSPKPNDNATDTLVSLLKEHPNYSIKVIMDTLDQSYVKHTLPPVTPIGVKKIVQRRLDRDFSEDDIKGYISLGREKSGRKDWNFMLIALANNENIRNWCDLLYDMPNRFIGIYLAPVEAQTLIHTIKKRVLTNASASDDVGEKKKKTLSFKKKAVDDDGAMQRSDVSHWDIFITNNKTGGFRQVVMKDDKLIFTRMSHILDDSNISVLAGNIEQETKNTIEYLRRLSFSNNSKLNIFVIVGEDIKKVLSKDAFSTDHTEILTPHEAAKFLKVEDSILSGDRYSDVLISAAFHQAKKEQLKLTTHFIRSAENLYGYITTLKVATVLGALGLIAASGYFMYNAFSYSSEASALQQDARNVTQRLETFERDAKDFKEDPYVVDSLIKITDIISQASPDFLSIIPKIAKAIDNNVTISGLEWNVGAASDTAITDGSAPQATDGNTMTTATVSTTEIRFEVSARNSQEKNASNIWARKYDLLKTELPDYDVIQGASPELESASDEISINFETVKETDDKSQILEVPINIVGPKPKTEGAL